MKTEVLALEDKETLGVWSSSDVFCPKHWTSDASNQNFIQEFPHNVRHEAHLLAAVKLISVDLFYCIIYYHLAKTYKTAVTLRARLFVPNAFS